MFLGKSWALAATSLLPNAALLPIATLALKADMHPSVPPPLLSTFLKVGIVLYSRNKSPRHNGLPSLKCGESQGHGRAQEWRLITGNLLNIMVFSQFWW